MKRCGYCKKVLDDDRQSYCSEACAEKARSYGRKRRACVICGMPTQGDLYCSRDCALVQLKRSLGGVGLQISKREEERLIKFYRYFDENLEGWKRTG